MPRTSIRKKLKLVCLVPILVALADAQVCQGQKFQPPEGMLTVGLRETERHRPPIPEQRIVRAHGSPWSVFFWAHVDAGGRVLEVRGFQTDAPSHFDYRTEPLVQTIRKITYRPFLRDGVAAEAWVQDLVDVGTESDKLPPSGAATDFPAPVEPPDFSIKLSRSRCFGTCPIYSVVIHGDGTVEFHGAQYVAIPGDHQTRIAPEAAARLLERFRAAEFFAFKDKYVADVTDNPTYVLELAVGAKKKTVTDYVGTWVGMPTFVTDLEDAVDDAAGTDRWVRSGPKKPYSDEGGRNRSQFQAGWRNSGLCRRGRRVGSSTNLAC